MDSDDETILSKMDDHEIGEIVSLGEDQARKPLDQSEEGEDGTVLPLVETSVKQEVESEDEFRNGILIY